MTQPTLVVSDRVYIPKEVWGLLPDFLRKKIKDNFIQTTVNPRLCGVYASGRPCPTLKARGKAFCYRCPQSKQSLKCVYKTKTGISFERGNLEFVKDIIREIKQHAKCKVVDKRVYAKLPKKMMYYPNWDTLDKERTADQVELVDKWCTFGYGQIVCPPRYGKTILAMLLAAKLQTRCAIVIHQKELLDQFYETFVKFTDIVEQEKFIGRKLIKINPKPEEVKSLAVCLYTYQQFISSKGKQRLKDIRDSFGLLICDEAHSSAANTYSIVLSRFKSKYKMGLSATPEYNEKFFKSFAILGPPVIEGGDEQLSCDYRISSTGFILPSYQQWNSRAWNLFWAKLVKDKDRNSRIAELVRKDVKAGHKVVIPVKRVAHIPELISAIKAVLPNAKVAGLYSAVKDRQKVVANIKKGKYDVVIAINKLISVGFNAPPLSCIYLNAASLQFKKDAAYQEYSRIRTKMKGKKKPLIRILHDEGDKSTNSVKFLIKQMDKYKFEKKGQYEVY